MQQIDIEKTSLLDWLLTLAPFFNPLREGATSLASSQIKAWNF